MSETALSWSSFSLLNSSKHPQAPNDDDVDDDIDDDDDDDDYSIPQLHSPVKMRPIDLKSIPSSQLNTSTCRPIWLPVQTDNDESID